MTATDSAHFSGSASFTWTVTNTVTFGAIADQSSHVGTAVTAVHVAVVTAATGNKDAPDVINGDGDRTGYSVVEVGDNQAFADAKQKGAPLSGYVSPTARPTAAGS